MDLRGEHDVVLARQRARQAALLVGSDAHGGSLSLASAPGAGTTFRFTLPLSKQ